MLSDLATVPIAAAAAAGTVAAAAYLDAKYHIRHDLNILRKAGNSLATMRFLGSAMQKDEMLLFFILEDHALRQRPNQLFLIFENRTWTYIEFYKCVLRVGNWLLKDVGIQRGEIVALDGGNSPEYLMLWFALEAVGAIPSFVNNNLTGNSLTHCIKVGRAGNSRSTGLTQHSSANAVTFSATTRTNTTSSRLRKRCKVLG